MVFRYLTWGGRSKNQFWRLLPTWLTRNINQSRWLNAKSAQKQLLKLKKKWQLLGKISVQDNLTHMVVIDSSANTLLQRVEFGIWLKSKKLESQTPNSTHCKSLFAINTTLHPKLPLKICGVWAKFSRMWCLSQTPQILSQTPQMLVKFHRFWVDDLGGEGC